MGGNMRLKVYGSGEVTISFSPQEIDQQIEVLKALVLTNTPNLRTVDDIVTCLQILRVMKK